MSQSSVSIIGAGLSGGVLGRCLQKRGIPVVLYDRAKSSPRNGYGITLHASTYKPLLEVLGIDDNTFRKRVAVDAGIGGNGEIDPVKLVHVDSTLKPSSFRANRGMLETLIREGLDIRWEHGVKKVELPEGGSNITFENGQQSQSVTVVGADGVHSAVRKSLLPDVALKVLPAVAFNGKRWISRVEFDQLYAPAFAGSTIIERKVHNATLHISVSETGPDQVSISWIYSRASQGANDACFKPDRSTAEAQNIPNEFYQEISSLGPLDEPFKDVFNVQKMEGERILSWLMRTVEIDPGRLQELSKKRIFLMGDSCKAQPILGGQGANTAILDAIRLADEL